MVGDFDVIALRMVVVVSAIFSMIGCSLLASVLLSGVNIMVIGTNLTVVVSCFGVVVVVIVGLFIMVTFWTVCIGVDIDNNGGAFVELIDFGVVEWNAVVAVDVVAESNENKCGIVF